MEFQYIENPQIKRHLPFNLKKDEIIYKSLNDIVEILNEALDMKITVRTLTQGTGHYVLQKDRVVDFLPCCKSTKYRGTIFVNDIGFRDTLVKYLNTSNSTIQTRSNATMENIIKVRINSNTLIQMLDHMDGIFEITKGVTINDIPINSYVRTHNIKPKGLKSKDNTDDNMDDQYNDNYNNIY
ncbi:hypothetical protein PIROE2DRAFT_6990, partial [Piromyces sp. E2]